MVISRTDAKKRRKEEEELEDVLPGSPKRTKVHAQRKFAQGSSNLSSPALTPVKDKDKVRCNGTVVSPDIIPSNRPKTEDFLTFLCFRGTSILPSHLDFFNTATYTESVEEEINEVSPAQPVLTIGLNRRSDKLESHPQHKKTATAVQALKKKYKEQRLARQRAANLKKLAQRVKGKNMIRTRSTTLREESKTNKVKIISGKTDLFPKQPVKLVHIARRIRALKRRLPVKRVAVHKNEVIRRVGLRSGGLLSTTTEQIARTEHLKPKKEKSLSKGFHSTMSDFSSDDDKPLVKKVGQLDQKKNRKQQLARRVVKRIVHVHRRARPQIITRSRQQEIASVSRPTRKTKEAATVYMEMLGKKLASVDMDQDEDSLSIDSFPELPNARKLEQREIEIRTRNIKGESHKEKPKGDSHSVVKLNKKQVHLDPKVSDKVSVMKDIVPKVKLPSSKLKFCGRRKTFSDKVGKSVRMLTRGQRLHKEKKNLSRKSHENFIDESKKKHTFSKSTPKQNKQLSSVGRKYNQKCSIHSDLDDIDDKFSDSDEEPLGKIATKINLKGKVPIQKKGKVLNSESVVETRQRSGKKVVNFKNLNESSTAIDKKSVLVNRTIENSSPLKTMKTSSLKASKVIKKSTNVGKIIMKGSKVISIKNKQTKNLEIIDDKAASSVKVECKTKEKSVSIVKSTLESKVSSEKKVSRTPVKPSQCSLPEETEVEIQRRLSLVSLKDSAKDSVNFEEYSNTSSNMVTNIKESVSKSLKKSNFKETHSSPDNSFVITSSVHEIKCIKHVRGDTSLINKKNSKSFTEIHHDLHCTQKSEFLGTNENVKLNSHLQLNIHSSKCSIKETENILETSMPVSDCDMDSNLKVSKAKETSNLKRKNIGNDKSVLEDIGTELSKDNLIIVNTTDNVLPGFDLSQENKGKMSTERIEKWLSESCSGTIEHKSDCPVFSSNLCKCMSAAEDDEYFEKLSIEGYSKRQYFSDISEQEMFKLENIREGRHKTKLLEFEVSETLEKDSFNETKRPDIKQQPLNFVCSGGTNYEASKTEVIEDHISTSSYQTPKISDCISKNNSLNKNEYYELESVDEYCVNKTRRSKVCKMVGSAGNKSKIKVPTTPEKKAIFNQRRSFTHKGRQKKELVPSVNAFSPENESSVYAFECDADLQPVKTPFRRQARDSRTSSSTTSKSEEDLPKLLEESLPSVLVTSPSILSKGPVNCSLSENVNSVETQCCSTTNEDCPTMVQIGTSTKNCSNRPRETSVAAGIQTDSYSPVFVVPDDISTPVGKKECDNVITNSYWQTSKETVRHEVSKQSTSIAVQVNLDSDPDSGTEQETPQRSMEISTQTEGAEEEDDEEGHLFYIPLQATESTDGSSSSHMIQGVAVKLGTEGPTGPNQRVIMRAKLVTKPPSFSHSTAVSRSVLGTSAVQKTTPVGTVQPTARSKPLGTTEPSISKERRSSVEQAAVTMTKNSPSTSRRMSQKSKCVRAVDPSLVLSPINVTKFPNKDGAAQLVQAPTFHPTEKEFQDPLEFIDKIRPVAEKFGLCRVVPPPTFKPECKVSDDMRFTAYNQYVHKMLHRWGPNVKEMMAIKKYLATQSISLTNPPWVGGMEVDLPRLYQTVQNFGGLKEVIEKKRWHRVADSMRIAKSAQDRVTKLDDIYCKYLLPYDTLSPDERQKLFDEVEKDWEQRESRGQHCDASSASDALEDDSDDAVDDNEECIVKGRSMPLSTFYRIARNTMAMWFKQTEPPSAEVEQEFWRHVMTRQSHVCVHSGSIDSSGWGYGFPVSKNSPFARHPWNLKVLTNNSGSVLRSLGPVMGVTVPTLHVGMLFTTCCWYRDPHGLPWIEYLHTGASKIWYGIPDSQSSVFRTALMKLLPKYCRSRTIWLPSDTAMVSPPLLVENGVSLCHTVQDPGQFIVVFPRAFTSSICTGYLVSESVYFAQPSWLETAQQAFKDIHESCEPSMFSLEKLIFSIANDSRSSFDVLKQVIPMILQVREKEIQLRKQLFALGLKTSERLPLPERKKSRSAREEDGDYECEICRANLFLSLVTNSHEEGVYCLSHAIELLTKKRHHLKFCKLMYTYDQSELNEIVQKAQERMEAKKGQKKGTKS